MLTPRPIPLTRLVHALREEVRSTSKDPLPNLLAGLTVAIVALPLALAFGLIAFGPEVGPAAGLWSAIIAGSIAAILGGSRYAITGPTGVLAVFTAELVLSHGGFGSPDALLFGFLAVALSGLFQVLFGALRLARVVEYLPYPVVTGFMNGIALIILWSGVQYVVAPTGGAMATWSATVSAFMGTAPPMVYAAALLALVAFLVSWGYPKLVARWPDRGLLRVAKRVPGSILALALLAGAAWLLAPLAGLPRIAALPQGAPHFSLDLSLLARHPEWTKDLILGALGLAAISSLDTLLTCVIADGVVGDKTNGDRELVGQGVANAVAGAFGANQACGAALRTVVNVKNGGRTRLSALSHAVILLLLLLLAAKQATLVPLAVLSGILFTTGVGMIEWRSLVEAHKAPKSDTLVMLATTISVVWLGLVEAVALGVVLASFLFVKRMTEMTDFVGEPEWTGGQRHGLEDLKGRVLVYEVRGPLFFGAAARFSQTMERASLREERVIIMRMNAMTTIDETGLRSLDVILERARRHGTLLVLAHVPPGAAEKLERFGFNDRLGRENVVPTFDAALARARAYLASNP